MFYYVIIEDKDGNEYFIKNEKDLNKIKKKIEKFKKFEDFIADGYILNRKNIKRFKITESDDSCFCYANLEKNSEENKDKSISDIEKEIIKKMKDITEELIEL